MTENTNPTPRWIKPVAITATAVAVIGGGITAATAALISAERS